MVAIESDREFGLSVLQRVDDELKRRGDLFRKLGVQDIPGYKRAGGTESMPRCLLIIDEFQEFFSEDDKLAQEAAHQPPHYVGRCAHLTLQERAASEAVAKAAPDGYTLLINTDSPTTRAPHISDLEYDPFKDVDNFMLIGEWKTVWTVKGDSPYKKCLPNERVLIRVGSQVPGTQHRHSRNGNGSSGTGSEGVPEPPASTPVDPVTEGEKIVTLADQGNTITLAVGENFLE